MLRLLATAAAAVMLLSGCLDASTQDPSPPPGSEDGFMAGPALWEDPQNTPHPAFGWPTLSSPPSGDLPEFWAPIEPSRLDAGVSGLEHVAQTEGVTRAGGIAIFGSLLVVPGYGEPSAVVDISDPAAPRVLSTFESQGNSHRGAAIIAYPDGRLVTVISTSSIIDVWDITDPTQPRPLPVLEPGSGSHKVGVVPGTPIVYNAASDGGAATGTSNLGQGSGVTEIYDLTDPENPVELPTFENGYSCHHVFFWNNPAEDKFRALCAGIEYTQIWDTADPRAPTLIVNVPVHHGRAGTPSGAASIVAFSHFAGLNRDGTVLIVGDEMGGGGIPPGCVAGVSTGIVDPSTPIGALWFYDVSDETDPQLQGWYSPLNDPRIKDAATSCTAHHGRLVPDADGRDILAQAFYGAGVILIDFTDPMTPVAIDQFAQGSDTWEVWYNQGYLFTGDLARGVDVLRVV